MSTTTPSPYDEFNHPNLAEAAFGYPAIDNHAHPLLAESHRDEYAFEGAISEAQGKALMEDSVHTLASYRATAQLSGLLECENDWEDVKRARAELPYSELCDKFMLPTGIQCILIDDGLDGDGICEDVKWHDRFCTSPSKQIVRIEFVAQNILKELVPRISSSLSLLSAFTTLFNAALAKAAHDPFVAGFKSIACYRTGLGVSPEMGSTEEVEESSKSAVKRFQETGKLRIAEKPFNDYVVRLTMEAAGKCQKPVQFHTGLGDADISLVRSSPAHLQPLIAAYPDTPIVLLHSSYPFTQEAGYLASVYHNVYLDFGEVFPFVSKEGQRTIVRQVLELCPTTKILWSTDGHFWPETYYLGTIQAREVLYEVLSECIEHGELTEQQSVTVVRRALFDNSNALYHLGLEPDVQLGIKAAQMWRK